MSDKWSNRENKHNAAQHSTTTTGQGSPRKEKSMLSGQRDGQATGFIVKHRDFNKNTGSERSIVLPVDRQ